MEKFNMPVASVVKPLSQISNAVNAQHVMLAPVDGAELYTEAFAI
jgi:hypothetical protein